jgi:hypothetical protein
LEQLETIMTVWFGMNEFKKSPVPQAELVDQGIYAAFDSERLKWCR